jgi:hypothetical protein
MKKTGALFFPRMKMLLFKRLLTSCILFLLLSLGSLTGIGTAVGMRGGWYRPPIRSADSNYTTGHDIATRYGYVIFLCTLSASAILALAISFSGLLPWCRKQSGPPQNRASL